MQEELPPGNREASERRDVQSSGCISLKMLTSASPDCLEEGISEMDVLLGRNTTTWSHEGNRRFQRVITMMLDEYQAATDKASRNYMVSQVIAVIRQSGGRFKKKNPHTNQWEELSVDKVRTKVSHALRDGLDRKTGKRKHRKVRAQQRSESSFPPSTPPSGVFSKEEIVSDGSSSIASSTSSTTSCDFGWVLDDDKKDEDSEFLQLIDAVLGPTSKKSSLVDPFDFRGDTEPTPFDSSLVPDATELSVTRLLLEDTAPSWLFHEYHHVVLPHCHQQEFNPGDDFQGNSA
jgi:hypothetical protein